MVIYGVQAIFGALAIHGILYRLIAIDFRLRPAAGNALFRIVSDLKNNRRFRPSAGERLGWISWLTEGCETTELSTETEELFRQSQAYLSVLAMVAAIETLFGLLGTVAGFIVSESIDSMSLSLAFGTTFWGIVASLPPAVYLYCSEPFRNRMHFQMQSLLEATMQSTEPAKVEQIEAQTSVVCAPLNAEQRRSDGSKQKRARNHVSPIAVAAKPHAHSATLAASPAMSNRTIYTEGPSPTKIAEGVKISEGERALILLEATSDGLIDSESYRLASIPTT